MKARLAGLWRSMPLRLALLLVLLFTIVSLLSLAASYAVTQRSFEQAIRADLAQDMAGFRAAPGAAALARLVEAESRETDPNRLIISYIGPNGRIYGNGAIARDDLWRAFDHRAQPGRDHRPARGFREYSARQPAAHGVDRAFGRVDPCPPLKTAC